MKPFLVFPLLALGLLTACDKGTKPADPANPAKQEQGSSFREELVGRFSEQCMAYVPRDSAVLQAKAKQLCDCAAKRVADNVSLTDLGGFFQGNTQELHAKFADTVRHCAQEQLLPAQASAASASQSQAK